MRRSPRNQFLQSLAGLKAIQNGHAQIEQNHIRLYLNRFFQQRSTVRGRADDLELRFQKFGKSLDHQRMVVRQENPRLPHVRRPHPCLVGTSPCTRPEDETVTQLSRKFSKPKARPKHQTATW